MPVFRLTKDLVFPPARLASREGLLAVGGDLSPPRLATAYSMGIFPWYSEGDPLLWWSPDPRLVLFPGELHVSRRLERTLRRGAFRVTLDEAFERVIRRCAAIDRPGQDGTWITNEMQAAYIRLHEMGLAHSAECWRHGELVGGLYGVSLGACFFGESMFTDVSDASKVAFATLVRQLQAWNFAVIDCQMTTSHLLRLGAREIPRGAFLRILDRALETPTRQEKWRLDSPSSLSTEQGSPLAGEEAARTS